jgi:hypothetical protein
MTRLVIACCALLVGLLVAGLALLAGSTQAADISRDGAPGDRAASAGVPQPDYRFGVPMPQLSQVGGIAELPGVAGSTEQVAETSERGRFGLAVVSAAVVLAALALSAGAWHAGRRS